MVGTAGIGKTGVVTACTRNGPGTKASGHDAHQNFLSEGTAEHAESDESSCCLDSTLSYRLSPDSNCYTTNVDVTDKTKDGAAPTNIVCGGSADIKVSTEGTCLGKTGVVGSDAHEEEGDNAPCNCLNITTELAILMSRLPLNAATMSYQVPPIKEVSVLTVKMMSDNVMVPVNGEESIGFVAARQ